MFKNARGQDVTMEQIVSRIADYLAEDVMADYEVTIGTDSQTFAHETKMVEVIAVHRVHKGGIYFYNTERITKIAALKQKIEEETSRSLANAKGFIDNLDMALIERDIDLDKMNFTFQIHCDIGKAGKTSMLIKEIVAWVTACGFKCTYKPDSYAASSIANRYSK